jgi:uncharacterized protein YecE (DUF72 family)
MIRAGIGGWTYEPWRGSFYPKGLPHARELEFASGKLTAIEINGTFYRLQKPETYRKWADETPSGFVFSLKAPRFAVNKRVLAEAGPSIALFVGSGLAELGDKLGPILWQFAPTKKFDATDFGAFLALLPQEVKGLRLRHALEVRHESFRSPQFFELAQKAGAAVVLADSDDYPCIAQETASFTYARLMKSRQEEPTGYTQAELSHWMEQAQNWSGGGRDAFVYFINGAKERAPAAAQAFLAMMGKG